MVTKKLGKWEISEDELLEKLQRSIQLGGEAPEASASKFTFNRVDRSIRIELPGHALLTFPASNIQELQNASDDEIEQGELIAAGTLLRWAKFDADYSIEGFVHGRYGTQDWMREWGRRGGQSTSAAKAAAARANGQKGGRPRHRPSETPSYSTTLVRTPEAVTASPLHIILVEKLITKIMDFKNPPMGATTTNNLCLT